MPDFFEACRTAVIAGTSHVSSPSQKRLQRDAWDSKEHHHSVWYY